MLWFKKKINNPFIEQVQDFVEKNYEPIEESSDIRYEKRVPAKSLAEFEAECSKINAEQNDSVSFSISDDVLDAEEEQSDVKFSISDTRETTEADEEQEFDELLNSVITQNEDSSSIDAYLKDTFSDSLVRYLIEKDLKNSTVYKAAKIDRRLFSKIISYKNYSPSRDTAIALAIALKLTSTETFEFLEKAGYTLSDSSKRDVIIKYFIRNKIYDIDIINDTLYKLNESTLGR